MATITPDGKIVTYTARYWRYFPECQEGGFDSLSEALGFLFRGEEEGDLSSIGVVDGDGALVFDARRTDSAWGRSEAFEEMWSAWGDGRLDEALMQWVEPVREAAALPNGSNHPK